jgi:hypothetical protein
MKLPRNGLKHKKALQRTFYILPAPAFYAKSLFIGFVKQPSTPDPTAPTDLDLPVFVSYRLGSTVM